MTIDLAAVAESYEIKLVLRQIEFVDDAVIANSQPELGATLKANVRKLLQPATQLTDSAFDSVANVRRQLEKDGIDLTRVNLGCLAHNY